MKPIFTLLLFIFSSLTGFSQAWDWTKIGGNGETINDIAIDGQRFFITAMGSKWDGAPFSYYGVLNKRDRHGNLVWQKRFSKPEPGSYGYNGIGSVVTDGLGNIYTSNNAYDSVNHVYVGRRGALCKYDFNGNLLWNREFYWFGQSGRGDIVGSAMTRDEQGNIYVTGLAGNTHSGYIFAVNNNFVFGSDTMVAAYPSGSYMVVAKLNKDGQLLWLKPYKYYHPSSYVHKTAITSIAVKNGQVAIAGTTNNTIIRFDSTEIVGGRGSNFFTLLNAGDGSVKWVKNIRFNGLTNTCLASCETPKPRVVFGNNNKLVFASAFMDTLNFGGIRYNANYKRQYYLAQYDTSGAEEVFKILPNDNLGDGLPNGYYPSYQDLALTNTGNQYYLHVLNHLYKMDASYNVLWTSTNILWSSSSGNANNHVALTVDPSGKVLGQATNLLGASTMAGSETITNPYTPGTVGYYSRINGENNIVSGYVFYDANNNGTKDPGELPAKNQLVGVPSGNRFIALTDSSGLYECLTDTGSFTFAPMSLPLYHTATPTGHSVTMNSYNQHIINKNFALAPIPGITDMAVDLIPLSATRPGFMASLKMVVTNKGTTTQTGTASLRLSNQLFFTNAYPAPVSATADSLVFAYNNLAPGYTKEFDVHYRVNPAMIFGTLLTSYATVYPVASDTVKINNYDTLAHPVTGAFDPNDKAVNLDGNVSIDRKNEALEYTIRFQNTGNDTAFNIRIIDTLSSKLNMASFELISSTHPVQAELNSDKVLTFYFDNILLVDSVHNEPKSHGALQFRIKPLPGIQINDSITNSAGIYFDYNAPVITNTTKTKYVGYPTVNLGNDITVCGGPVSLNAANAGARFVWSTGDTVQTVNISSSGTYWVRVSNQYGFSATDTIAITIKPLPAVNLGADITQCGGTVTLNAGNVGSSYLWGNGATTQNIMVTTSGSYGVKVTNADGCSKSDTIQVTINPLPTVNLGADITQCGGTVTLNAGNVGSSYLWSNGTTTQSNAVIASGTYHVKVTNANGCVGTDTIQVTINPLPTVNLGADIAQCGGTVSLNAGNAGSSYLWGNGATTQSITVNTSGSYGVKVTNADGCSKSDTIQVTIHPLPTVNLGADITQCGGTVSLNAGNLGSSYLWSNGAVIQNINVTASGVYAVKVTNANGCVASDTIQVTINPLPTVNLGADIAQCGGTVTLNAGNAGSSYLWGNGATTQSITVNTSGSYGVKVTNTNGCSKSDTVTVSIHPVPLVNLGADAGFCAGSAISLDAGNNGSTYAWNTGATTRQLTVSQGGQYSVRVTNTAGCASADTIQLTMRALPVLQLNLPDTLFASDAPVLLTAAPVGGQFSGTGVANGRFDATVAGQGRHTIRYHYTDAFGCSNQALGTVVVLTPIDKVKVYPNPNRGHFTVAVGHNFRNGSLTIVTPLGRVVGRFALSAFVQQLRVSLQPGIYYLQFSNTGLKETRRMLVW